MDTAFVVVLMIYRALVCWIADVIGWVAVLFDYSIQNFAKELAYRCAWRYLQ